jgi:ribosomal protein L10
MVGVDNVGSKQMQQIRQSLRGSAEVLMGKNTMIRKALRGHLDNNPALEKYVYHFYFNFLDKITVFNIIQNIFKLLQCANQETFVLPLEYTTLQDQGTL